MKSASNSASIGISSGSWKSFKNSKLAGGQFSVQNGDDFRLPKIHRKIHDLWLNQKEPEFSGAIESLIFVFFWDILVSTKACQWDREKVRECHQINLSMIFTENKTKVLTGYQSKRTFFHTSIIDSTVLVSDNPWFFGGRWWSFIKSTW